MSVPPARSAPLTLGDLASFALSVRWPDVPPAVRRRVMELITDGVAVAGAGSRAADLDGLYAALSERAGRSTAIGLRMPVSVDAAATLNAAAMWRFQYQEGHAAARGHPGAAALVALLAIAEELDAPAERFLSAFLATYEIGVRCGAALGGTVEGVHDLGAWGPVGIAGGVAVLSGGDWRSVAGAMAIAAQMALATSAPTVFRGDPAQYAFLPASLQIGLLAATFGLSGISPDPAESSRPFPSGPLRALARDRPHGAISLPSQDAEANWTILDGYIKMFPVCGLLLSAVEAAVALHRELVGLGETSRSIAALRVGVIPDAMIFSEPDPRSDLEARFSLPFTVAWALLHGSIWDDQLSERQLQEPDVMRLASAITMYALDAVEEGRPAVVEVALASGRTVTTRCPSERRSDGARSEDGSLTPERKARRLLLDAFGTEADAVAEAVAGLSDGSVSPRSLGVRLRGSSSRGSEVGD